MRGGEEGFLSFYFLNTITLDSVGETRNPKRFSQERMAVSVNSYYGSEYSAIRSIYHLSTILSTNV